MMDEPAKVYGQSPDDLGLFEIHPSEVFYYLYLPVSLAGMSDCKIPPQLALFEKLIWAVRENEPDRFRNEYVYITGKRMYVGPGISANRPGWHSDGFMTDDLNYVWYDCLPTIFNNGPFTISPDHVKSLREFETQANPLANYVYAPQRFLKLDQSVIHQVGVPDKQMMRTFIKISVSKHRYNLKDNSINHDLNYDWVLYDRAEIRNSPTATQTDFVPVKMGAASWAEGLMT